MKEVLDNICLKVMMELTYYTQSTPRMYEQKKCIKVNQVVLFLDKFKSVVLYFK